MAELPFIEYEGQTTDELLALAGAVRTDSLVLAFATALRSKSPLSISELTVVVVETFETEVNHGGFEFLFDHHAEVMSLVPVALDRIGRPELADLVREAIAAQERGDELAVAACDQRYYALGEDLAEPLRVYIQVHRAEIEVG